MKRLLYILTVFLVTTLTGGFAIAQSHTVTAGSLDYAYKTPEAQQPTQTVTPQVNRDDLEKARQLIRQRRYTQAYDLLMSVRDNYQDSTEWMQLILQVDDYFKRKEGKSRLYDIDRLTYVVRLNPRESNTRYQLIDRLMEVGRFYEAEQHLQAQQYINPDDAQFRIRMQQMASQKMEIANRQIATLEAKIQRNPRDIDALRQLGNFYQVIGDSNRAIQSYNQAINYQPNNLQLRYEYAQLLGGLGAYQEVLHEAESLIVADPYNPNYKNLYASASLFSGQINARTEQYLQEALALSPENIDMIANLALLRIYQGRLSEADQLARQAQTIAGNEYIPRLEELDDLIAQARKTGSISPKVNTQTSVQINSSPVANRPTSQPTTPVRIVETTENGSVSGRTTITQEGEMMYEGTGGDGGFRPSGTPVIRESAVIVQRPYQNTQASLATIQTANNQVRAQRTYIPNSRCESVLEKARELYHLGQFFDSADYYEEYFRCSGNVTGDLLIEMANAIEAGGDARSAISVLQAALQYGGYNEGVMHRMAQMRYDMGDTAGAITVLEALLETNPNNVEALMLLGDAYTRAGKYTLAYDTYRQAQVLAPRNRELEKRIGWIHSPNGGYNYAALINPYVQGVYAEGFRTDFQRISMGIDTQVTLPIPLVLTAGFTSHGVKGTRYQARPGLPGFKPGDLGGDIPKAEEWFNQISLGGFWDITKPLRYRLYQDNYTNRLALRGGLYDYSGGRTALFGQAQFFHQTPNFVKAGLGVSVDEGSLSLWAPGGAEDELRLTQFTGSLQFDHLLRDRIRLGLGGSYNIVNDMFSGFDNENRGISAWWDLGLRLLRETYIGANYYLLNYDNPTNYYFSPTNYAYQENALYLEHLMTASENSFFRIRGTGGVIGPIGNVSDFSFIRGKLDWIYRIRNNFAFGLNAQASKAFRYRNKSDLYNDYNIYFGGLSLYWTL